MLLLVTHRATQYKRVGSSGRLVMLCCRLGSVSVVVLCAVLLGNAGGAAGLRCYVCGGNSGTACQGEDEVEDGLVIQVVPCCTAVSSNYRDNMQDPVQECNDLINNRGCVKQYVNGGKII